MKKCYKPVRICVYCFNHLDQLALCNDDVFQFLFKKLTIFTHGFLFSLRLKEICTKIKANLINFDFMQGSVVRPNIGGGSAEPPNLSKNRGSAEHVRLNRTFGAPLTLTLQ